MNGSNSNTSGATVAKVSFSGKPTCVSADARSEIERDMNVTVIQSSDGDIWPGTQPPEDKTLIWWPKDTTSGVRIGKPKTWDAATNSWIELGQAPTVVLPERRFGSDTVSAAASQSKEIPISPVMPSADFFFSLSPTTRVGSTFQAASSNMDDFGWEIIGMEAGKVTLQLFNVPTGGLGLDWRAEQKS